MKSKASTFLSLLAPSLILLSGCAEFIKSDVNISQALTNSVANKRYIFVPSSSQKGNAEYVVYQDLIRQELSKHQFKEASKGQKYSAIVSFNYGIDGGTTTSIEGKANTSEPSSLASANALGTISGTSGFTPAYDTRGSSATEYSREFSLHIIDTNSLKDKRAHLLFAGNVQSTGFSSQLPEVMPEMIKALLKVLPSK